MYSNKTGVLSTYLERNRRVTYWCAVPFGPDGKIVLLFAKLTSLWTVATHKVEMITAIVLVAGILLTSLSLVNTTILCLLCRRLDLYVICTEITGPGAIGFHEQTIRIAIILVVQNKRGTYCQEVATTTVVATSCTILFHKFRLCLAEFLVTCDEIHAVFWHFIFTILIYGTWC